MTRSRLPPAYLRLPRDGNALFWRDMLREGHNVTLLPPDGREPWPRYCGWAEGQKPEVTTPLPAELHALAEALADLFILEETRRRVLREGEGHSCQNH